jgi:putative membrane protein insertion efficiency factor
MRKMLQGMVRLYQKAVSPHLPSQCRFWPTCSDYFLQALDKKGLACAVMLGLWRLLRCNPFCKGGYDPLP